MKRNGTWNSSPSLKEKRKVGGLALHHYGRPHGGRNQGGPGRDNEFLTKTRKQRRGGRGALLTNLLEPVDTCKLKIRKKTEEGMGGGGGEGE